MDEGRLEGGQRKEKMEKAGMNKEWKRRETERRKKSDPETSRCRCYAFGSKEQRDDEDQALT